MKYQIHISCIVDDVFKVEAPNKKEAEKIGYEAISNLPGTIENIEIDVSEITSGYSN